jgi:hypothetical protein
MSNQNMMGNAGFGSGGHWGFAHHDMNNGFGNNQGW